MKAEDPRHAPADFFLRPAGGRAPAVLLDLAKREPDAVLIARG